MVLIGLGECPRCIISIAWGTQGGLAIRATCWPWLFEMMPAMLTKRVRRVENVNLPRKQNDGIL